MKNITRMIMVLVSCVGFAADWPSYGGNTNVSFVTTDQLTLPLTNHWTYQSDHPPVPAFKNLTGSELQYSLGIRENTTKLDFVPHTAIAGNSVCFSEGIDGFVVCLDTASGLTNWVFSPNGEVSVPPTISDSKVYFGSDDGFVYCLNLSDGSLVWQVDGTPDNHSLIVSGKMISHYPVKTSITVDDGIAYFGVGILPSHGVWLNAVDASDGSLVWQKKIDYSANGVILVDEDRLFVPAGRVSATEWYKADGAFVSSAGIPDRRAGGSSVISKLGDMLVYYNEEATARIRTVDDGSENTSTYGYAGIGGKFSGLPARQMLATTNQIFILRTEKVGGEYKRFLHALTTNFYTSLIESSDRGGFNSDLGSHIEGFMEPYFRDDQLDADLLSCTVWSNQLDDAVDCFAMINAGSHLFGGGKDKVFALDVNTGSTVWEAAVDGDVYGLSVADGALFASTTEGKVYCFRNNPSGGTDRVPSFSNPYSSSALYEEAADLVIAHADQTNGWCVVLGAGEAGGQLAYEIAIRSQLTVIGVEDDDAKLTAARANLRQAGLYGSRVVMHKNVDATFPYPNMFANVIVSEEAIETGALPASSQNVLNLLKPYGGLILMGHQSGSLDLSGWAIDGLSAWTNVVGAQADWQLATRGPITGGGVWDHHYADLGNTFCSEDQHVGTNLMFQWMGAPGSGDVPDRHYMAMPPLFRNGKLIYGGAETSLMCMDPYNGTELWKIDIEGMIRQRLPLVNGFLCMDDDFVYAAATGSCHKIDLDSGAITDTFSIPDAETGYDWGFIAVKDDLVYGSKIKEEASYNAFFDINEIINKEFVRPIACKSLFAKSKTNGAVAWNYETNSVILNMGIAFGGGSIFFVESYNSTAVNDVNGCVDLLDFFSPGEAYIVSLNEDTGEENWRTPVSRSGAETYVHSSYLLYKDDRLVAVRGDVFTNAAGDTVDYVFDGLNATDGSAVWTNRVSGGFGSPLAGNKNSSHMHPTIVGDQIFLNRNNFEPYMYIMDLQDGARTDVSYPINDKACGAKPASAKALFYRKTIMRAYDIETQTAATLNETTRSSCWASSIPCGGLLMMPEGGAGCACGTAFQLSCAMAPRGPAGTVIASTVDSVNVPEGGTVEFGIKLSAPPSNSVTVTVAKESGGDGDLSVTGGSSLSFNSSNWSSNQTVTLSAVADADAIEGTAVLMCTGTDLVSKVIMVREQELSPQSPSVSINGGDAETLSLDVTLTLSASGPTPSHMMLSTNVGFSGASWETYAVSKPWNFSGAPGIKAVYAKFHTNSFESVTVSNSIEFIRGIVVTNRIDVPEDGTQSFWVTLSSDPEASLTLTVTQESGDADLSVQSGSPASFTSGNWDTGISITLAAADDGDWTADSAQFKCAVSGLTDAFLTAYEIENDIDPTYILPWQETFENDGTNAGTAGPLGTQHGWTSTSAIVTNAQAQAGSQSCQINEGQISHLFTDNQTHVNVTLYAQPTISEIAPENIPANASAVFYVNTNNLIVAYSNTTPLEIAGATVSNDWNKIEVSCDFISKVWNLELNDVPRVGNFPFYTDTQSNFDELLILNGVSNAFIDSIQIVRVATGSDTDADGIPDSWEEEHFGGTTNAVATNLCANGINTVLEAYVADLNPTNPASKFLMSSVFSPQSSVLSWDSASGRVYTVYWASNLLNGFQTLETNVPWTGVPFSDTNHTTEQKGFYKIEVEME